MEKLKAFTIYELYFLASAFDCQILFGLPNLKDLHIIPNETWNQVRESLQAKKILDDSFSLIEEGFFVISMLEEYCNTVSLTVMNNFLIASCDNKDYSIIISQNKDQEYYIFKIDFVMMIHFLSDKLPLYINRIPLEEEKSFLKKELILTDELKEIFISNDALIMQYYPFQELKKNKNLRNDSWVFAIYNNKIYGLDMHKEKVYYFSQYYFLERIYTWMNIPFKKKEENKENDKWKFF